MSFNSLPRDILHLWVKDYVRTFDYHRLLRVCKLFHVLNTEERIKKEYQRKLDQKAASSQRRKNCHKLCPTCSHPVSKKRKQRHGPYICQMFMKQTRENDFEKFTTHILCRIVICEYCELKERYEKVETWVHNFYFPKMAEHRKSCPGMISYKKVYTSPYPKAEERWLKRLEAREINIRKKEEEKHRIHRETMRDLFFMFY